MNFRILFTAVLFLAVSSYVFAQKPSGGNTAGGNAGAPGTSGTSQPLNTSPGFGTQGAEVRIRISWPNERPVEDSTIHVQLLNATAVPIMESFVNHDGYVTFHSVPAGTYHVKLDGPAIKETVGDSFEISYLERMHMEWVHVAPKDDNQNANGAPGAPPTVSASELNVPSKAKNELDKGLEAFSKGDLKKAEERMRKAIEIYPKYANAWNNLGVILMRDNSPDSALDAFQKSVQVDDKFAPAYLNLARLSLRANKVPEADGYINKALSFDPNNVEGLALLAKTDLMTGHWADALTHARKALAVPNHRLPEIHLIAGEALLHQNQRAEAVKEYEAYLKEDPESPNAAQVRAAMAQLQAKQN